jgi:dinuclear metal center YbgI/SA1388 family protein
MTIAASNPPVTVGELVKALFQIFPADNAQAEDRIGLQVGDPAATVKKVAVVLDPTTDAITKAAALGCQAVVSHHPAYWFAPREFVASGKESLLGGAAAFAAARHGVAVIAMHTNLDAAPQAREMLLAPIGYHYTAPLQLINAQRDAAIIAANPLAPVAALGQIAAPISGWQQTQDMTCRSQADVGQIAAPISGWQQTDNAFGGTPQAPTLAELANFGGTPQAPTLLELANRCANAFGSVAKVWGDASKQIVRLAVCSGAGGCTLADVVENGADCFLTGELYHHEVIALSGQGIAAIELGHDISELPYRSFIAAALRQIGFAGANVVILDPGANWWALQAGGLQPASTDGDAAAGQTPEAAGQTPVRFYGALSYADLEEMTDV